MLSMSNVSSVASAATYYAEDNYYSSDENQAMSVWAGKGAAALGLEGPVDPADFAKVLSGEVGDAKLGRIVGTGPDGELVREHRPGFDVTLSAPKSVSLLAEVAGRKDVREAHEAAVTKVLEYMEAHYAQARVTEAGETRTVHTGNLVVGRFHHTTSRDLDPQTHTHLVIANATQLENGHWRSVSNELIYKNQKLLGAIYDSELAANLRALGYRLESTPEGHWEVAGISRDQIEKFSQRSQAIAERLEKFGLTRDTATAAQREDAALRTRDAKREVDHHALREDWKERASSMGIDFQKIEADRAQGAAPPTSAQVSDAQADDAVRFAIAHLTERESVVPRGTVIETALDHAVKAAPWAQVRVEAVEAALADRVSSQVVLTLKEDRITTSEALERERTMFTLLEAGRGSAVPIMGAQKVDVAIAEFERSKSEGNDRPFRLTIGQEEAARTTLTSADQFLGLQGYAGVGKTTMLELVRIAAEAEGYQVRGMAPSAEAARTLQNETGIESVTTARFLLDEGRRAANAGKPTLTEVEVFGAVDMQGKDWRMLSVSLPGRPHPVVHGSKEMWVMDEASLSGQRELTQLMDMTNKAGARLVLVGDRLQHNAVEAGKPFEMLQQAGIGGAVMSDINRQHVDDLKHAVAAAVQRQNVKALAALRERIVSVEDKSQLLGRVASDILSKHPHDREKALIVVPLNSDRHSINNKVREGLQGRKEIGPDLATATILVPTGYTDAQKQSTAYYSEGMVVRFGREYRSFGTGKGEYGTVVGVDRPGHVVRLQMEDGRAVAWSPEKHGKIETYEVDERKLGVGDEIRFTRNNKDQGINNGTLGKVESIGSDHIVLATANGPITLKGAEKSSAHWDYAYAMTVYASQGRTTNDANLLITADSGRAMGERSFYVGITRPRLDMTIYTDDVGRAMKLITQQQDKTSAVEWLGAQQSSGGAGNADDAGRTGKGAPGGRGAGAEL